MLRAKGIISFLSEIESGESNGYSWARQTVVLDIPGYAGTFKKVAFEARNSIVNDVESFNLGETVEVDYSITAREYNGKWYNRIGLVSIRGFKEEPTQDVQTEKVKETKENSLEPQKDDLPF